MFLYNTSGKTLLMAIIFVLLTLLAILNWSVFPEHIINCFVRCSITMKKGKKRKELERDEEKILCLRIYACKKNLYRRKKEIQNK